MRDSLPICKHIFLSSGLEIFVAGYRCFFFVSMDWKYLLDPIIGIWDCLGVLLSIEQSKFLVFMADSLF